MSLAFANGSLPPQVTLLANAGPRMHHDDAKGGGYITRTIYVEPYLAYPWVELFLKGTVVNNGGIWQRILPHADPIRPFFYCSEVVITPFAPETVTGQALTIYAPSNDFSYNAGGGGGQQNSINQVLGAVDDHGMTNFVDFGPDAPLTNAQILQGGNSNSYSGGKCGAYITATYTPLIFLDGINTSPGGGPVQSPFDYVLESDWSTNEEVSTQTGRSLFVFSPNVLTANAGGILGGAAAMLAALVPGNQGQPNPGNTENAGLSDTFSRPETIVRYKIKRLMVPFEPQLTIGAYSKKINGEAGNTALGNLSFPKWTLRFDHCDKDMKIAPDGAKFYDLTMNFSRRVIFEDMYNDLPNGTCWNGADYPSGISIKNWITWNHHYAVPADRITGVQVGAAGYYPVCWNGGAFQIFGNPRNLYIGDNETSQPAGYAGVFSGNMLSDLFTSGFRLFQ